MFKTCIYMFLVLVKLLNIETIFPVSDILFYPYIYEFLTDILVVKNIIHIH